MNEPGIVGEQAAQLESSIIRKDVGLLQRLRRNLLAIEACALVVWSVVLALLTGRNDILLSNILALIVALGFFWSCYLLHIRVARAGGPRVDVILLIIEAIVTVGVSIAVGIALDIHRYILAKLFYRGDAPVQYAFNPNSKVRYQEWKLPSTSVPRMSAFNTAAMIPGPRASNEAEQLLHSLQGGLMFGRVEAAAKLGKLTESNERIVAALVLARDHDANSKVQAAAAEALQAPVHQAVLNKNPDLVKSIVSQIAAENQQRREQAARQAVIAANMGEQRMKWGAILFFGGLIVTIVTYMMASSSSSGGTYLVCWGPVIFGLIMMIQGYTQSNR